MDSDKDASCPSCYCCIHISQRDDEKKRSEESTNEERRGKGGSGRGKAIQNKEVKPFTSEMLKKCHAILRARRYYNKPYSHFNLPASCHANLGYHSACYRTFSALKSREILSVPSEYKITFDENVANAPGPSSTPASASTSRPKREKLVLSSGVLKRICIICKKSRKTHCRKEQQLIEATTGNFEMKIREAAEKLKDYHLLGRVSDRDFVAQEVKYHRICALNYLAKAKRVVGKQSTSWHSIRESHNHAFNYICQFIQCHILSKGEVFTLKELYKEYIDVIQEYRLVNSLDSKEKAKFPATNLRDKILSKFSGLSKGSNLLVDIKGNQCLFFKEGSNMVASVVSQKLKEMEKFGQSREVARELRRDIVGQSKKPLPLESVEVRNVTEGECEVPEALTEFLSILITGESNLREHQQRAKRRVDSIAQDIIYAATNGRMKPEKHLSLGMAMKTLTGSRKVINILNRFGHTASYSAVEEMETEISYTAFNQSSILPACLKPFPSLYTGVAFDNFDRFVETRTGKDTLHDTVGIVFQNSSNEGENQLEETDTEMIPLLPENRNTAIKRRRRAFEEVFKDVEPYMKKPKPIIPISPESSHSPLPGRELRKQALCDYRNVDIFWALLFQYGVDMTPMWVGFNALTFIDDLPTQEIAYLPQINASPTSYSVVLHTMKIALNLAEECMQDSIICSYDLNIAKMALQIQEEEKPTFDALFIFPGTFHIEDAFFKALGKIIDGSGITDILSECGIVATGSISGFIGGTNYNRCRSVHPLIALAFRMMHYEMYVQHLTALSEEGSESFRYSDYSSMQQRLTSAKNQTVAPGASFIMDAELECRISEYREFEEQTLAGAHGKTAQFWVMYVMYMDTYHDFVRSVRMGDLDLFQKSLALMTDLFFALNHANYARWNVVYIDNLKEAVLKNNMVAQQLNKGIFGIKRTSKNFSRSPIDLTLEQTINGDAGNKLGGLSSMTNSISARQRWAISHTQRTEIVSHVLEKAGLSKKEDVTNDLKTYRVSSDSARLQALLKAMEGYVNPFAGDEQQDVLFNICTGKSVRDETADFLLNVPQAGRNQHDEFRAVCSKNPAKFNEPIKRNTIKNFASENAKLKISRRDKVKEVKNERNLFARLLTISLQNHIDLQAVMSFPLTPVPSALGHSDGSLMKTNKSALFQILEKKVQHQPPNKVDVTIIDAFYFLHLLGNNLPPSFGGVAKAIIAKVSKLQCKTVYIVFDTYIKPSIKDVERNARARGADNVTQYNITSENQKRPQDFIKALRNDNFKQALNSFLLQEWKKPLYKELFEGISVYANEKDNFLFYSSSDEGVYHANVPSLTNSHAEADTKMVYLLTTITKGNVVIKSSDTDVLVIAIGNIHHVRKEVNVFIETGTVSKNNMRYINVRSIADHIGSPVSQALPGFHALTGSDFTSSFYKVGKLKPMKILETNTEFQSSLGKFGLTETLSEQEFQETEKVVCSFYSRKKTFKNIDDLRFAMFLDVYNKKSGSDPLKVSKGIDSCSLPPCRQVLREHVLRCKFVTILWSNLNSPHPPRIPPTDYGWLEENGSYVLRWYKGPALPNSLEDILLGTAEQDDNDDDSFESDISLSDDDCEED